MLENIAADMRHYLRSPNRVGTRDFFYLLFSELSFQAIVTYRLGQWLRSGTVASRIGWPLAYPFFLILQAFVRSAYDIRIDVTAKIGSGLYIGHFGGIQVRECCIGSGCSIQQQVRIGPALPGEPGPTIGNRVWIGAHAQVEGPFHVGDGATVAAGSVVTGNVAPNCLWLGRPGRIVRFNYDNTPFL